MLDSINDKAIEEREEKTKSNAAKTQVSPTLDTQAKLLPKIEKGNTETVLPVMSTKRLGKHNRVYSNCLSVIVERSPKESKKANASKDANEAKHQSN